MKAIANPPALREFPPACPPPAPSPERIYVVKDLPQLLERVLALKPHDQVEMILSVDKPEANASGIYDNLEERGYLMDIRVGPEANICVKRTF